MKLADLEYRFLKVKEFERRGLPLPRIHDGVNDAYDDELFCSILAYMPDYDWDNHDPDKIYAGMDYGIHKGVIHIKMITTKEQYTRLGLAAELIDHVAKKHKLPIDAGMSTKSGSKLVAFLNKNGYSL